MLVANLETIPTGVYIWALFNKLSESYINLFQPILNFYQPLKTSEKTKGKEIWKWNIDLKWFKKRDDERIVLYFHVELKWVLDIKLRNLGTIEQVKMIKN